ncbi:hypothetical protein EST38_g2376 [Candolleomyces aberdarensis]|uniref:Uncharacterized protein n=1 Tax=Candolleomyces aberdarensis TaxID=2316362 RepID=A0A4Q2DT34_9AGAR|nr:hypothetical protein EST38_g2376 [Candolleomyces aberdarensis]
MQHRAPSPVGPGRYDPARFGNRDREYEADRGYPPSPEHVRGGPRPPSFANTPRRSESPHPSRSVEAKSRRRVRESKELDIQPHPHQTPVPQHPPPPPQIVSSQSSTPIIQDPSTRKRRKNVSRRKDDSGGSETPKPEPQRSNSFKVTPYDQGSNGSSGSERGSFKLVQSPDPNMADHRFRMQPPYTVPKGPNSPDERQSFKHASSYSSFKGSPEPSASSTSARSIQPSPTNAAPRPPIRRIDEDYDEGVNALMDLAQHQYRPAPPPPESATPASEHAAQSPMVSPRAPQQPSPRPPPSHRNSVSSNLSHASPAAQAAQLKRPRSPGGASDESEQSKRSRTDSSRRRSSMSGGRMTPVHGSTRPSPIPFRTQPASHSPEARNVPAEMYERASPPLGGVVLPPHPRPVGAGHSSVSQAPMTVPPIATLSPPASPPVHGDERDDRRGRTTSPPMRKDFGGRGMSRTPPTKHTPSPPMEKEQA